jgi:hypothetical protein
MRVLDICLSDIPKDRIKEGRNGKKYLDIVVTEMRQPDNYGNDLTVYVQQTKEERQDKAPKIYIGKGKTYSFDKEQPQPLPNEGDNTTSPEHDDLPF